MMIRFQIIEHIAYPDSLAVSGLIKTVSGTHPGPGEAKTAAMDEAK